MPVAFQVSQELSPTYMPTIGWVQAGDEVLVPAVTFIATANAVSYCNAIPHLVDVEHRTLGLDPNKLYDYLQEIIEFRRGLL